MRVTGQIPIERIKSKKRLPLGLKAFQFALAMKRGEKFPPVKLQRSVTGDGNYVLKDGRHRVSAAKLLGHKTVFALYSVVEEPYPYKPFVCNGKNTHRAIPQADGCSAPFNATPKE